VNRGLLFEESALIASILALDGGCRVSTKNGLCYYPAAAQLAGLLTCPQVEVLRGPQEHFMDASNPGCVVICDNTALPARIKKATAGFTYGNYNTLNLEGAVGGPINDKLMYRLLVNLRVYRRYGTTRATWKPCEPRSVCCAWLAFI